MNYPFTGGGQTELRITNREDLLTYVSVYDDDLGQAIRLDGTNVNGTAAFTSSAWTVTDGSIVTTSSTSITIPVFPIGNQLSALALTVGTGLNILAGDAIQIKDTATGLNTMTGTVVSYASATGALVCQIGWTFQFEIRKLGRDTDFFTNGYVPWQDIGTIADYGPIISASLGSGIEIVDTGIIQIRIPESMIRQLSSHSYLISMTGTDGYDTRQLLLDSLHVLYGGVTN